MNSIREHAEPSQDIDKDRVFGDGSKYENQDDQDGVEVSGVEAIGDGNTLYEVILRKVVKIGQVQIVETRAVELLHGWELLPVQKNIFELDLYDNVSLDNEEFVEG